MEQLFKVLDEMASAPDNQYVTIKQVLEVYYGRPVIKLSAEGDYNRLKQELHRLKKVLSYQNGKTIKNGFRYKEGCENYLLSQEEESMLRSKIGDDRQLFLTGGLQMLFKGSSVLEHLVELECVSDLKNLKLVKVLANYLGKQVIKFRYHQGYENMQNITMHPHLLKEYNSRWFLFGYVVNDQDENEVVCFSLDRIVYQNSASISPCPDIPIRQAPKYFYRQYFKDIVGVTKMKDKELETFTIKTTNHMVHQLIKTKPIHSSQDPNPTFDFEKNEGEITFSVIPNIELQTRLLSYGDGIVLKGNSEFKERLKSVIARMAALYKLTRIMIKSEKVTLRPWYEDDAPTLFKYASDPDVGPGAGWAPHKNVEESLEIIRTFFNNDHTWAIEFKEKGEVIGAIGYLLPAESNVSIGENDVEIGYWVAKPYWNQGICTEALSLLIDHCFKDKHFQNIWGDFFVDNPASGRVMEKCGFQETGDMSFCNHLYGGDNRPVKIMILHREK